MRPVPESEVREQEAGFRDLLRELGTASDEELRKALEERGAAALEEGITASLIERLHAR